MEKTEQIKAIICSYVDVDPALLGETALLRTDIGATSFDLMNIAVAMEEAFGVSISNTEMLTVKNVGDLAALLET